MVQPILTLIPQRSVVALDREAILDLLIKVEVPEPEIQIKRPALNLGLVLDRSGSMSGEKLHFAKKAAVYLVDQLTGDDRISLTIFDDEVNVLVPSMVADNRSALQKMIGSIRAGGSTALFNGWRQGAEQVSQFHDVSRLNRVILLSDGQANVGETNPDTIADRVHRLLGKGTSTTSMGVGDDYNEDLLEAMARSGDGNYYYIQSPDELPSIFKVELHGLAALVGQRASIGVRGLEGVEVVDVLNDFGRTNAGNYKPPNLIHGACVQVVVRLRVPALTEEKDMCGIELAFDVPDSGTRSSQKAVLRLAPIPSGQLDEFPENEQVKRAVALLMAARARKEAVRYLDRGDHAAARSTLSDAMGFIAGAPPAPVLKEEMDMIADLNQDLDSGDVERLRKKATFQSYQRRRGRQ